jgi:hypothetical protein
MPPWGMRTEQRNQQSNVACSEKSTARGAPGEPCAQAIPVQPSPDSGMESLTSEIDGVERLSPEDADFERPSAFIFRKAVHFA